MRTLLAWLRDWWRIVAVAFVPIAITLLLARFEGPALRQLLERLHAAGTAWWAVPAFVAAYVLFAVLLLPVGLLSTAAAVTWGWKVGGAIELLTCTAAALVPFYGVRGRLADWIERRVTRAGKAAPSFTGDDGTFILLLLRIVPVVPYVALNYIAGVARVRTRDYILTTFLGSIPVVFVYAYFVDALAAGASGTATELRVIAACGAAGLLAVAVRWLGKKYLKKGEE
jgi:uncharacterized membrane protein YdjX (TVP38/TMEM64 family)